MRVFDYIVLFWLIFISLYLFVAPFKAMIDGLI
jgi:hypothetical protein